MSTFRLRISAWIALTAYGLSSLVAQGLHDHAHQHAGEQHEHHTHGDTGTGTNSAAHACACGLEHHDEDSSIPEPADRSTKPVEALHAHSGCHAGHNHSHPHHPSHDDGECPACRYLAVKPAATAPVVVPVLLERIGKAERLVQIAPDVPLRAMPNPRGPPASAC